MELLLTVLKLLWAVRGEQTGRQHGGPPVPGGAADAGGGGGLAGKPLRLPSGGPPHARLLTGTPVKPPETARPLAHEGEGGLPSD